MQHHVYQPARNPGWKGKCTYQEGDEICRLLGSAQIHRIGRSRQGPHVFIPGDLYLPDGNPDLCGFRAAEFGFHCRAPRDAEIHRLARKEFGQGQAITCPFGPHGGTVYVRGEGSSTLIEQHDMGFNVLHPEMMCPASLMHWPLGDAEKGALAQQAKDLVQQFNRDLRIEAEDPAFFPKKPLPESQPLKHKGRMGREPEPASEDWALGGREDEDVPRADEVVTGVVPDHVQGQSVGRSGMISESANTAQGAMRRSEDAIEALRNAVSDLGGVTNTVVELLGDGGSASLRSWLENLRMAQDGVNDAIRQAAQGNEHAGQYIRNISG